MKNVKFGSTRTVQTYCNNEWAKCSFRNQVGWKIDSRDAEVTGNISVVTCKECLDNYTVEQIIT